jgi:hypothetical protein
LKRYSPARQTLANQGLSVMRAGRDRVAIVDRSLLAQGVVAATAPTFVDLSWRRGAKATGYTILRDGTRLTQTSKWGTSFRDGSVVAGRSYRYSIIPSLPETSTGNDRMWSMKVKVPTPSGGETSASLESPAIAQAVHLAVAPTTTVTWETFIPQSKINAPMVGCGKYGRGYQFGGDGRSYDWRSARFRTALNAVITWRNKSVAGYTAVGSSKVYRKSTGALVATKTASTSGMSAKKLGSGSTYVAVRMVTHASMPFCSVGAVDGAFSMNLTQSGNYSIFSGNHRQMPNHHVYIYDGGQVTNVYRRNYASALCLVGSAACPLAQLTSYRGSF